MKSLFVQVLALCGQRSLVDLSAVAVDGSPMDANASREGNQRLHRLEEIISRREDEINALMDDALANARPCSQSAKVSAVWSGRTSTGRRVTMSIRIVPNRRPRLNAKSLTPRTSTSGTGGSCRRRIRRRSVEPLIGMDKRVARRSPAFPPSVNGTCSRAC
ncbi:hypothetical protein [Streptomyces sp. RTd22]|uniref:hypothetical protein n=1 Tax=Streptomyces sp. RTd22 TaxID=1841249 RepID=UPI00131E0392|nr:hypothetical protein [Streptomyces sp. RTd22]